MRQRPPAVGVIFKCLSGIRKDIPIAFEFKEESHKCNAT